MREFILRIGVRGVYCLYLFFLPFFGSTVFLKCLINISDTCIAKACSEFSLQYGGGNRIRLVEGGGEVVGLLVV